MFVPDCGSIVFLCVSTLSADSLDFFKNFLKALISWMSPSLLSLISLGHSYQTLLVRYRVASDDLIKLC